MAEDDPRYEELTGFNLAGDDPLAELQEHIEDHEFVSEMNMTLESFDDDTLRTHIPHNEHWANPGMDGTLHGGVVVAFLDTVMGFALMAAAADRSINGGPTVNLNTNFLSTATGDIKAVGDVVRIGSSTAMVDGRLRDADSGELVATAQGVWRVYPE